MDDEIRFLALEEPLSKLEGVREAHKEVKLDYAQINLFKKAVKIKQRKMKLEYEKKFVIPQTLIPIKLSTEMKLQQRIFFQSTLKPETLPPPPVPRTQKIEQPGILAQPRLLLSRPAPTLPIVQLTQPPLPLQARVKEPLCYGVIKQNGFAIVSIEVNSEYKIIEPEVPEQILNELKQYGRKLEKEKFVLKKIKKFCDRFEIPYSDELAFKIKYYTDREFGFGALEPLMQDKNVGAIICDMYNEPVSIIYNGKKMKTNLILNKEDLFALINLLARQCNKKISKKEPMLDEMINGIRVQLFYGSDFVSPKFIIAKPI